MKNKEHALKLKEKVLMLNLSIYLTKSIKNK